MTVQYLLFPENFQPLQSDIDRTFNANLANIGGARWGWDEESDTLALEFDAEPFHQFRSRNMAFKELMSKWLFEGAEYRDELDFSPDEPALQPWDDVTQVLDRREARRQAHQDKQYAIGEARAKAWKKKKRALDGIEGFSKAVTVAAPLVLLGTAAAFGIHSCRKTADEIKKIEPRRNAIKRVAEDPIHEDLQHKIDKDPEDIDHTPDGTVNTNETIRYQQRSSGKSR